jgi:hypothetical protein
MLDTVIHAAPAFLWKEILNNWNPFLLMYVLYEKERDYPTQFKSHGYYRTGSKGNLPLYKKKRSRRYLKNVKLSLSASVCCFSWRGSGRRGKVGMAVLLWTQVEIVSLHKPARYPLDKQDLSYSPHGLSLLGLGPLQIVFSSVSQHLYLKGLGNQIEFKYLDKNN